MTPTHIVVRPIQALIVIGLVLVVIAVSGIAYTNRVQRQSDERDQLRQQQADQRWCALLNLAAGAPTARPPGITDEEWQRRLAGAVELEKLRKSLGC